MVNHGHDPLINWDFEWGWKHIIFGAILIFSLGGFGIYHACQPGSSLTRTQIDYHSNNVMVKTIAQFEPGPMLHRVIDFDLKKVCYLNGAGGGIWCIPLEEALQGKDPKLIEDILSPVNANGFYNKEKFKLNTTEYYPKDFKPTPLSSPIPYHNAVRNGTHPSKYYE